MPDAQRNAGRETVERLKATECNVPHAGVEEFIMASININELNEEMTISEEEMTQVKGGPAFLKLGDIKGESTDAVDGHKKWSDLLSVSYNR